MRMPTKAGLTSTTIIDKLHCCHDIRKYGSSLSCWLLDDIPHNDLPISTCTTKHTHARRRPPLWSWFPIHKGYHFSSKNHNTQSAIIPSIRSTLWTCPSQLQPSVCVRSISKRNIAHKLWEAKKVHYSHLANRLISSEKNAISATRCLFQLECQYML